MKSAFLLTKYDYATGKHSALSVFTDKFNAYQTLESLVTEYIVNMDGSNRISDDTPLESITFSTAKLGHSLSKQIQFLTSKPVGHYVLVDGSSDHVHKCTVWQHRLVKKTSRGMFGKSETQVPSIAKVFDVDVVELPFSIFKTMFRNVRNQLISDRVDKIEPSDLLSSARIEAITTPAWANFTTAFQQTDTCKALAEQYKPLSSLKTEFPLEFSLYRKPPSFGLSTPVSEAPTLHCSVYVELIEEMVAAVPDIIESEEDGAVDIHCSLPPLPPLPQEAREWSKKLAGEAMGEFAKRIQKRAETGGEWMLENLPEPLADVEAPNVKPPWMGLKKILE
jgi:hypothetical protein